MMKRIFALALAVMLCVCGIASASQYAGRWVGSTVEAGAFGMTCDLAGVDLVLLLNEDGTAVMTLNGETDTDTWHEEDGTIVIGEISMLITEDGLLWQMSENGIDFSVTLVPEEEPEEEEAE